MLCTEEVSRAIHPGMHGTTFGGSPLACAVAIAVFDAIEHDGLLDHVQAVGQHFFEGLKELQARHAMITDVRGRGLMLAIEVESAELAKAVLAEMTARHILINRTSETVLRFLPPYLLGMGEVDYALSQLDAALTQVGSAQLAAAGERGGKIGD